MPRRKQIFPGSVYKRATSNKLYIRYRNKDYATGVDDTPQGRVIAQRHLEQMHEKWLRRDFVEPASKKSPTFKSAWAEFERDHLAHKHARTQESYRYAYKKVCGEKDLKLTKANLKDVAQEFFNTCTHTPAGRNVILRSFRVFCLWCAEKEFCDKVSFKRLMVPTQKPIRTYTAHEIEQILEHYRSTDEMYYLLFSFLHQTGTRLTETLEIRKADIHSDRILMSNKIHKTEFDMIPLSDTVAKIIDRLKELRPSAETLFGWDRDHARVIRKSFKRACERLSIENHGIHSIRKTFASDLIQNGVDLVHVKDLMRHKSIQTTLSHYHALKIDTLLDIVNTVR